MSGANTNSAVQFMQNLLESIFQSIEHDQDALSELYAESGIDRDGLVSNILTRIKAERLQQRQAAAKARREEWVALLTQLKEKRLSLKKGDLVEKLREFLQPEEGSPALAFFHKLEAMPEHDVREMLNEIDLLSLIDQVTKRE